MVGRLAPWKGQDLFLRAFSRALRCIDADARIIGSAMFGEHQYERGLAGQVGALGLHDRVEFRGFRSDVAAELREIDVLVHASTIPEPFGQVVLEGMAAGLPVIAANAGGPAELISHRLDGLLYPPGDEDALAAAIVAVGRDARQRRQLGVAAWQRARCFTPQRAANAVEAVYANLLTVTPARCRQLDST